MAKEYLMVNGKLVLVDNQLVQLPNETEYSNALDGEIISLASTEELTNDIMTQLKGYVNGSPKRAFDNLTTLRNTHPNGAIGTYLCKDTKHFYIWNGSTWEDCGLYLTNPLEPSVLPNGTVVSNNADFAEVGKGEIGDGYFVTTIGYDSNYNVPIIAKANSTSDIRGVTVSNPAFCAGIKSNFLDHDELRRGFAFVGFAGIVNVIDNGKCTVNGNLVSRCMSASDGTATPSSNNMGYQIISRVDSKTIRIVVEPSADMIQRIKTDVSELMSQTGVGDGLIWNDGNDRIHYYATAVEDTEIANKNYVDTKTYGYTHSNGQIDISTESGGVNIGSVQGNIDITSDGGAVNITASNGESVNITASNGESVNITSTNDCVYIDARVDVNLIGDAIYLTSENVELNSDYTPSAKNSVVNKGYVDSLKSELIGLRETLYGVTSLETTSVRIEDGGVVPQIVSVGGQDYNVVPKGDVSVLSVEGDSVRCENLLPIENSIFETNNSSWGGYSFFFNHLNFKAGNYTIYFKIRTLNNGKPQVIKIWGSGKVITEIIINKLSINNDWSVASFNFILPDSAIDRIFFQHYLDSGTFQITDIMLVRGDVAPTQFQPYFEGLKHTEYKSVTISSPNLIPSLEGITNSDIVRYCTFNNNEITINGNVTSPLHIVADLNLPNRTYTFKDFGQITGYGNVYLMSDDSDYSNEVLTNGTVTKAIQKILFVIGAGNYTNFKIKPMLVRGSNAPTSFIPYYSTPILSVPTTLKGVEGYRDTLEVRLNEDTLLYDVYKVVRTKTFTWTRQTPYVMGAGGGVNVVIVNNVYGGTKQLSGIGDRVTPTKTSVWMRGQEFKVNIVHLNSENFRYDLNVGNMSLSEFNIWLEKAPINITHDIIEPIETKIASNLTFDQVTALVHTLSNVKIVNPNDIYLTKPKVNLGLVYKKVIS